MKKRLIGLSFIALGVVTLASCGGTNVMNKEYKNNITKGNSVDNITIEYYDTISGALKNISISSTDTYKEMTNKLSVAYRNTFGPDNKLDSYYPFYETATRRYNTSEKNGVFKDVEKNADGKISQKENAEYVVGDRKDDRYTEYYGTVYLYSSSNESFYLDGYKTNIVEEYNNIPAGTLKSTINDEANDRGVYYKYTGKPSEGSIEYASNNAHMYEIQFTQDSGIDSNYKMYYSKNWDSRDTYSDVFASYESEDKTMIFNPRQIAAGQPDSVRVYPYFYVGVPYFVVQVSYPTDSQFYLDYEEYYENSFEITDKYLIIKNKINTSEQAIRLAEEQGFTKSQAESLFKEYEGSYSYNEVWLNYKQTKKAESVYNLGYDYFKSDSVEKRNREIVLSVNTTPYDEATLNKLGVNGKINSQSSLNESHFESYKVDISDSEINNIKNNFINKCKDDNILTKYKFTKSDKKY